MPVLHERQAAQIVGFPTGTAAIPRDAVRREVVEVRRLVVIDESALKSPRYGDAACRRHTSAAPVGERCGFLLGIDSPWHPDIADRPSWMPVAVLAVASTAIAQIKADDTGALVSVAFDDACDSERSQPCLWVAHRAFRGRPSSAAGSAATWLRAAGDPARSRPADRGRAVPGSAEALLSSLALSSRHTGA